MEYGIHWFRRDLRIAGNDALKVNFKKNKGKVVGIFCFDKSFLSRPDFSHNRFQFFIESLFELRNELRTIGSDLLVLDMEPLIAWKWLIDKLKKKNNSLPGLITWNRDYEPFCSH
jgi:deoxyribodipyrimidine photo-lyase